MGAAHHPEFLMRRDFLATWQHRMMRDFHRQAFPHAPAVPDITDLTLEWVEDLIAVRLLKIEEQQDLARE